MPQDLEEIINIDDTLVFILTPVSCDKMDIYRTITKCSDLIKNNHKLVTIDKQDNHDQISYEEFVKYQSEQNNTFFFIDNVKFFMYYNIEWYNRSNILIFLINIMDIEDSAYIHNRTKFKAMSLYPKMLCVDVEIEYNKSTTYITKDQLTYYKKEYLKFIEDKNKQINPSNYLNVYYDKVLNSLENVSLEMALDRAPKFKNIFLQILLKNKKRHLVHLPDNRYGIEPFEIIFNKLNTNITLIVIKSIEDYDSKLKNLAKFNKDNSPAVLLTDYYFVGTNVPKNINLYHITNGGSDEDIISIFDYVKVVNKSSSDKRDRKFEIFNHIATTIKGELTVNDVKEIDFSKKLNSYTTTFNRLKKDGGKIYFEGPKLKIESQNR
tara:strand:+ start:182 stop:1318 length:1137 start_codon:yes stop_codon:yes gene_type:complete